MYNHKQYDAARDFVQTSNTGYINNVDDMWDKLRLKVYDLYEDIYINSTYNLKIILRGEDQSPILMPTGKKLIESVNRFLGINIDYLVEGQGDEGTQQDLDDWFKQFFKREKFKAKFESGKRWGLARGDSIWYIYGDYLKDQGERISVREIDPRQVFEIEDIQGYVAGYHLVDLVRDWREPEQPQKMITRRRTFRKDIDEDGCVIKLAPVTSELAFFELNAWDDRNPENEVELIPNGGAHGAHDPITLSAIDNSPITSFPLYKWNNNPMQNTNWGTSQLAGLETLMYALNQSMTDEDTTIVFQGMGMYVTTAGAPIDPNTGQYTDWNIGPMQIIEIGQDQKFDRVTGVNNVTPFQDHMNFIDEKGLSESSGIPQVAIGKVDPQSVQSGIALKLELMPLLAQNGEKELGLINLVDQMFHDIVTQWLPAFEYEVFGNFDAMQEMSVVCLFDDPMPVDRTSIIEELVTLKTNNFILMTMVIKKLRSIGYQYPSIDDQGNVITDDDLVQMLLDEAGEFAQVGLGVLGQPDLTNAANPNNNSNSNGSGNGQAPPGANTPPFKTTVPLSAG